jgi:hypothetical protein
MEEGEKKPGAGAISGGPQKKIVYAIIAVAVVILAVVLVAKFGFGADLLNPAGGQMSLVQRPPITIVRPDVTLTGQETQLAVSVKTPAFQRVTTPIPRLLSCTADQTNCNGVCVNLNTDNGNCGSCGHACPSGNLCTYGKCCASPVGDPKNCGGVSCFVASGNIYAPCGEFSCEAMCLEINPWDADCSLTTGAQHVKLYSDVNNCGGCGFRCNATEICDHMKCQKH